MSTSTGGTATVNNNGITNTNDGADLITGKVQRHSQTHNIKTIIYHSQTDNINHIMQYIHSQSNGFKVKKVY